MIVPSLIYAHITILLACIDTMRIKEKWNKVGNIDHKPSWALAMFSGMAVFGFSFMELIGSGWWGFLACVIVGLGFVCIRLALYDLALNIFRRWTGTNPTGRIDYVSTTTSSYEDQHSEKVGFWMKRAMGTAGFVVMFLLYKVIFRV